MGLHDIISLIACKFKFQPWHTFYWGAMGVQCPPCMMCEHGNLTIYGLRTCDVGCHAFAFLASCEVSSMRYFCISCIVWRCFPCGTKIIAKISFNHFFCWQDDIMSFSKNGILTLVGVVIINHTCIKIYFLNHIL